MWVASCVAGDSVLLASSDGMAIRYFTNDQQVAFPPARPGLLPSLTEDIHVACFGPSCMLQAARYQSVTGCACALLSSPFAYFRQWGMI